jgi:hypothetical protein
VNPAVVEAFGKAVAELAAELAAKIVADKLAGAAGPTPRYATAKVNPTGSRRAFLDAARENAFPTFQRGKQTAAMWSDVEAWMRARPPITRARPGDNGEELSLRDELLIAASPRKRKRGTGA